MTTLTQDVQAIVLTPAAVAKAQAAGADLPVLMTQLQTHIAEKQRLIKEIIRLHPSTGGVRQIGRRSMQSWPSFEKVCGGAVMFAAASCGRVVGSQPVRRIILEQSISAISFLDRRVAAR